MAYEGFTRRNFVRFSVIGAGAAAAALAAGPAEAGAAEVRAASDYPEQIKIAHLTDIHYFSKNLWSDCEDYRLAESSDRKMFKESGAILDKALDELVAFQPDVVLVTGDITKDGELVCHQEVHAKIASAAERLAQAGKTTHFLVINGNHDINNDDNGRDFSSGIAEHTDLVDPVAFKELWADCGYNSAYALFDEGGNRGGSLSYAVRPVKGLTVIAVDSGKYSTDQNGLDRDEHVTGGVVGERLLAWIESQAKQARAAGDLVIAMQHHGVIPHFDMEPQVMGEYLVDNYEECLERYAAAGISAVFTGHMHANDIASAQASTGEVLYDIETCSTVTYPSETRFATLGWERQGKTANIEATLAVENHSLGAVDYVDFATGASAPIADIAAYADEHLLSVDVVKTMIADALVAPMLVSMRENGGVRPALASLLAGLGLGENITPENMGESLFPMLMGLLPQSKDAAITVALGDLSSLIKSYGVAGIWANAAAGRIVVERADVAEGAATLSLDPTDEVQDGIAAAALAAPDPEGRAAKYWSYYIDAASLTAFLNTLLTNVDSIVLDKNAEDVLNVIRQLVVTLLAQPVASSKNLFDLVKFTYGSHLHGNEACPAWAEAAIANSALTGNDAEGNPIADGSVTSFLRAAVNNTENLDALTALLKKIKIKLSELMVKDQGTGPLGLIGIVVSSVGSIVGFLGDTPGNMIPNIPAVTDLAHGVMYTMTHDSNVADDREHTVIATLVDPDWKPGSSTGGDGDGDGGNTDNGGNGGTGTGNAGGTSGSPTPDTVKPTGKPGSGAGKLPQTGDRPGIMAALVAGAGVLAAALGLKERDADLDVD